MGKKMEILRSKKPDLLQYFSKIPGAPQMTHASSNKKLKKKKREREREGTILAVPVSQNHSSSWNILVKGMLKPK